MEIKSEPHGASTTAGQEVAESGSSSLSPRRTADAGSEVTSPALRSAHRKLDRRLVLWYAAVYLVMRIHVSNISNTAIINLEQGDGIKAQLGGLTSGQWAWVLSVFYYPYLFLEPLATLALKKFGPRRWMARIMVTWVCHRVVMVRMARIR